MKKFAWVLLFLLTTVMLASCQNDKEADIVTTMFPQYDFSRQIVGDKLSVSMLIPPGADIHNFEASSRDMVAISKSKLFIYTSLEIDQWIKDPETIGGEETIVLDLSEHVILEPHEHEHETHHTTALALDDDHDHDDDLHYWVDPTNAIQMIEAILEKIIFIDPEHADFYTANAQAYIETIHDIHDDIELFFEDEMHHDATIYFAGHNAMGAFAERYHLNIVPLFDDFKPDADLTSAELTSFVNQVRQSGTAYLFIEALIEPKAALSIQTELKNQYDYDLTLLVLHSYHNLSKSDMDDGITYADLMQMNLDHLTQALGGLTL